MILFFKGTVRKAAHKVFHNVINSRYRRRVISRFADKLGLVYFGNVDQLSDDYEVVRGFTVSSSHQDNHYCVGSVDDHDIAVVDRDYAVWQTDGSVSIYHWLIVAIDLHTKQDIPHVFISAHNNDIKPYSAFFVANHTMREINLGTFETYDRDFTSRFSIYSQPSESIEVERLFPASCARVLAAHFWPLSIEIKDGYLYIYSDDKKITSNVLDTMLESGLWLANHLDIQSELV